jgi:acyl-CoA synthetase (AMP-forming)/AMP-acid ligase II
MEPKAFTGRERPAARCSSCCTAKVHLASGNCVRMQKPRPAWMHTGALVYIENSEIVFAGRYRPAIPEGTRMC